MLVVESWPLRARVIIATASGTVYRGRAPLRRRIWAGAEVILDVLAPGHSPRRRRFVMGHQRTHLIACLDPRDQLVRCQRIVQTEALPKSVALSQDGRRAWVAHLGVTPGVAVFDIRSGRRLAAVPLNYKGGTEILVPPRSRYAYASQMTTGSVFEIDRRKHRVRRVLSTGGRWTKMMVRSADGGTLYASNWTSNSISAIDLKRGKLRRRYRTGRWPRGMLLSKDGRALYVANFGDGRVERLDLRTGKRRALYRGGSMRHIVADQRRGLLYASDINRAQVVQIDLRRGTSRVLAKTDDKPNTIALGYGGRVLFVSCRGTNNKKSYHKPGEVWGSVLLVDTRSGRVLDAIVTGNQTTGLDVSRDSKILVATDFLDSRMRVYELPTYTELAAAGGGRALTYRRDLLKHKRDRNRHLPR